MWKRSEVKKRAKGALKGSYWKGFAVAFGMALATNIGSGLSGVFSGRDPVVAFVISILITLIVQSLAGYSLQVGGRRYFNQAAQGDVNMKYLGDGFKGDQFFEIFKSMILVDLLVMAWSLLLIVPGLIKAHAYSMVPFILADNPEIGPKRAVELSEQMTKGHKWKIFILTLSFLGWYYLLAIISVVIIALTGHQMAVLGMAIAGMGALLLAPYINATMSELYLVLRQDSFEKGICEHEELNYEEA